MRVRWGILGRFFRLNLQSRTFFFFLFWKLDRILALLWQMTVSFDVGILARFSDDSFKVLQLFLLQSSFEILFQMFSSQVSKDWLSVAFFFFFKLLDDSSEENPIEKTWPVNILSRWFPPTLFHVLVTISLHRISSDYLVALAGADFHQLGGLTRVGKWDQYVPLLLCCSGPFRWYRCEMSTAASFQSNTGGDIIWQRGSRHTHTTFRTDRKNLVESNWAGNKWTLIAYGSNW